MVTKEQSEGDTGGLADRLATQHGDPFQLLPLRGSESKVQRSRAAFRLHTQTCNTVLLGLSSNHCLAKRD